MATRKHRTTEIVGDSLESVAASQLETTEDVESPDLTTGGAAVLAASDWTTQTILNQLDRGNIELNPIFQRRDAWRAPRKSHFIESLVLGLPVPQLVLAERKDARGTYIIIDGKQRLLTLRQFSATPQSGFEPLRLRDLRICTHLNGMEYRDLQSNPSLVKDLNAFEKYTLRTVVIRNWPSEEFLYTVFLRLNTGSVPLSPQELRQALHPGEFTLFVNEYSANSEPLREILGLTQPDFRMRDAELLLRYLAFENFMPQYTGNLKQFLDDVVIHFNRTWLTQSAAVTAQAHSLDRAITTASDIFGDDAFKKWNGKQFESRLNRAIFDTVVHYFSDPQVAKSAKAKRTAVVSAFKHLCESSEAFATSVGGTTKSLDAVFTRYYEWGRSLATATGVKVILPHRVENRIKM